MPSLYLDTPLSKAILLFFNHLEQSVLKTTAKPGSVKAYLFGGCALHIHTNARGSNDIDVEFNSAKWVTAKDIIITKPSITYVDDGVKMVLSFDQCFTPMLGPLHEDYIEDAIQLQTRFNASPLWIYVVTAADLAISKLGRYSEQDRQDILTLLTANKMKIDDFQKRATEALQYYVGNVSVVESHLRQVVSFYHKMKK